MQKNLSIGFHRREGKIKCVLLCDCQVCRKIHTQNSEPSSLRFFSDTLCDIQDQNENP